MVARNSGAMVRHVGKSPGFCSVEQGLDSERLAGNFSYFNELILRLTLESPNTRQVKMESHPAWVKRLRMASIWTKSGQETSTREKKRSSFTKSRPFPQRPKDRVCDFTPAASSAAADVLPAGCANMT